MDAHPPSTPTAKRPPRWVRVAFFVAMIVLVQSGVAFLLTWIEPPRATLQRVIDLSHGHAVFAPDAWLAGHELRPDASKSSATRKDAKAMLDEFARCRPNQPAVLVVRAPAIVAESGQLVLLSPDVTAQDVASGLRLADVLLALRACPSKQKLLMLDLAPPLASAWRGYVHHDLGAAIACELDALPDQDRLVLSMCTAGEMPHGSPDFGASVFAHYVDEGLRGHAD
ncbi:MAG TPA: hypothetical protein VFE62_09395, partial [Gemmataceae bacterium]|nr:hypothetical protein [Gemmataceae bacterium]